VNRAQRRHIRPPADQPATAFAHPTDVGRRLLAALREAAPPGSTVLEAIELAIPAIEAEARSQVKAGEETATILRAAVTTKGDGALNAEWEARIRETVVGLDRDLMVLTAGTARALLAEIDRLRAEVVEQAWDGR
jgi:hypothetical protein